MPASTHASPSLDTTCCPSARAYSWPATDATDAELRRAVAYRHACIVVNDTYLVGVNGLADLERCAQTYSFARGVIATHIAAQRLTKTERVHVTLMAAQFIAANAEIALGSSASKVRAASAMFSGLGAESRLPLTEMRAPRSAKEAVVGAAIVDALRQACATADATLAAGESAPSKPGRAHLRLVK